MQPNYPQDIPPRNPQPLPQPQQPPAYQQPQPQPQPQPQFFNEQPQQPQQPVAQPQYTQNQFNGGTQDPYDQQLQPNLYGTQPASQPISMIATEDKPSKKPIVIIMIAVGALLLLGLIGGGIFAWQSGMFGGATEEVVEQQEEAPAENTYDTPDLIETEIVDTQKALDAIDDSQLADDTISDQTLNQ